MSVVQARAPRRLTRAEEGEAKVSPLELFFDLVFVFALTQVTAFMAADPTFTSMGRSVLVLALLWWMWSGYAWLTSTVDPEQVLPRVVMFGAMAAMLVVALAVPGAFGADGEIWAAGYIAIRVLHATLFYVAARGAGDQALARNVRFLMVSLVPGGGLILLGALAFDGATRDLLWVAAVILDYGIVLVLADVGSWKVHAEHFAERFALVMIIAFGESIVAIGIGAEDVALEAAEIASALVGITIVCLLWWAYFDTYALVAGRRLREAVGVDQARIARDAYALLHFPMITGVVFFALGVKKVLEHPGDPLKDMPAVALCGGLALYALAHVAFRLRNTGTLAVPRVIAAAACLAVIPLATSGAALTALAVLAVIWLALITYETLRYADRRAQIRGAGAHG
jgi:low temperature requirement protein LtrA